jgi:hypothetical protein
MENTFFSRRRILQAASALGLTPLVPRLARASSNPAKRVVMIRAWGAWDVTYCLDPRLSSASVDGPDSDGSPGTNSIETFGSSGGIDIMVNDTSRGSVTEFFDAHADQSIVVRGIYTGSIVHDECRIRMTTGTRSGNNPDFGVLSCVEHADDYVLPYIDLTGGAYTGPYAALTGNLGARKQIIGLLDRDLAIPPPTDQTFTFPQFNPGDSGRAVLDSYVSSRTERFLERDLGGGPTAQRLADLTESQSRRDLLREDKDIFIDNLNFGSSGTFLQQAQLAVTLLASGVCYSVGLDSGLNWDTHDDISDQNALYQSLFSGLGSLIEALQEAGLYEDTLIVVVSEFSRTPKINEDGGKDHWGFTSSLLLGGGIDGGRVLGGTDNSLVGKGIDLSTGLVDTGEESLNYDSFVAGVLNAAGVDLSSGEWLSNVEALHGIVD